MNSEIEIVPSIIGKQFSEIRSKIQSVEGLTKWAQIDIVDGRFAPFQTWNNPSELNNLDGKIKIEVHLMVLEPEKIIKEWIHLRRDEVNVVDRAIIHYEAIAHFEKITDIFESLPRLGGDSPAKIGIALNLETPIEVLDNNLAEKAGLIQLMSITEIGEYGHKLDNRVFDKLLSLRKKYPSVTISIDGGVNLDNARELARCGADRLVVGSAIFGQGDIKTNVDSFIKLFKKKDGPSSR